MLVLFLRTFKYIFPYFFPLNNECACECVQRSFSARHFPSIVDRWLGSRVNASASPSCLPLNNRLVRRLCHSILPFGRKQSSATPTECICHPRPQQRHGHHQANEHQPHRLDTRITMQHTNDSHRTCCVM